ncbi:AAA family ATPase [Microbacterium oxydans]|nr:AAA family ATPase [Microbacterium oxydans]
MRIREVWIGLYKSFNFDYELKATPGSKPKPWQQMLANGWMPHVRVPIEPDITAVVGANESGKTHLLDAIKIALTGDGLLQRDFCRSSSFFRWSRGSRLYPEVGLTVTPVGEEPTVLSANNIPVLKNGDVLLLRPEPGVTVVVNSDEERVTLTTEQGGSTSGNAAAFARAQDRGCAPGLGPDLRACA